MGIIAIAQAGASAATAEDGLVASGFAQALMGPGTPFSLPNLFSIPARPAGEVAGRAADAEAERPRTRFVIGLDKPVEAQVLTLADPPRLLIDFPEVRHELPALLAGQPLGLVRSFRSGIIAPGRMRVVVDVAGPVVVERQTIERGRDGRGHRLVLDLVAVDPSRSAAARRALSQQPSALGAATVDPPAPQPALRPRSKGQALYQPLVVIDPGHGGHDSGAQRHGTVEKDVVLAFSLRLRDKLLASGRYKVVMTRDSDKFVDLDERRELAERHGAALFIAVHADYASSGARGATIYSLKDSTARELQRSAKGEVTETVLSAKEIDAVRKVDGSVDAVAGILAELARREVAVHKERTNLFTRSVVEYMGGSTSMMSNPEREANFRVLKSGKTPSVLIELAYITNQQDALNLKSDSWRDKVSGSILTAIENYFSHQVARLPM